MPGRDSNDSFMVRVGWESVSAGIVADNETPSGRFWSPALTMLMSARSSFGTAEALFGKVIMRFCRGLSLPRRFRFGLFLDEGGTFGFRFGALLLLLNLVQ